MTDIVIYNKKYIFGLCPVSGTELSDESVKVSHVM